MDTIFKEKTTNNTKIIDKKYCEELDEEIKLIPIYFKPVFNKIFLKREFLKEFLILELNLDKSLKNQSTFYGKSPIYNTYAPYVEKTSIIINMNGNIVPFTFAKIDHKNGTSNKIYALNLSNTRIKDKNNYERTDFKKVKKDINYYRHLYNRGVKLDKKSLLLVIMTSKSFKELYEILIKIFSEAETANIIRQVKRASQNIHIIKKWEQYQKYK